MNCYKYIIDLTTNGVVITDAIKFVQTNKERLTISNKKEQDVAPSTAVRSSLIQKS